MTTQEHCCAVRQVEQICTFAKDGIATIRVVLHDVELSDDIVLAAVVEPCSGASFDVCKRNDVSQAERREHSTAEATTIDGGSLPLDVTFDRQFSNRLRIATLQKPKRPPYKFSTVSWRFLISNALPFMEPDLVIPGRDYWQRSEPDRLIPPGLCRRGYVLHIDCSELLYTLVFSADADVRSLYAVEETPHKFAGWFETSWKPASRAVALTPEPALDGDGKPCIRAQHLFTQAKPGNRYSIAFAPCVAPGWLGSEAPYNKGSDLIAYMRRSEREDDRNKALALEAELLDGIRKYLSVWRQPPKEQLKAIDAGFPGFQWKSAIDLRVFLWCEEQKALIPITGCVTRDDWARRFRYGEGVAGHCYRFGVPTTYYRKNKHGLLYRDISGEPKYRWIVCLPLGPPGEHNGRPLGVVSLAGLVKDPGDSLSSDLEEIAASELGDRPGAKGSEADTNGRLWNYGQAVNLGFWQVIATSKNSALPLATDVRSRIKAASADGSPASSVPRSTRSSHTRSSSSKQPSEHEPTTSKPSDEASKEPKAVLSTSLSPQEIARSSNPTRLPWKTIITTSGTVLVALIGILPGIWPNREDKPKPAAASGVSQITVEDANVEHLGHVDPKKCHLNKPCLGVSASAKLQVTLSAPGYAGAYYKSEGRYHLLQGQLIVNNADKGTLEISNDAASKNHCELWVVASHGPLERVSEMTELRELPDSPAGQVWGPLFLQTITPLPQTE